jgi:hypothetical protein
MVNILEAYAECELRILATAMLGVELDPPDLCSRDSEIKG